MGDKVTYEIGLIDKFSGPVSGVIKSIREVQREMDFVNEVAGRTGLGAGQVHLLADALKKANFAVSTLKTGLTLVAEAGIAAFASFSAGLGFFEKTVVKTLAFKENMLMSFEAMLGSRDAAKDMFKEAVLFSKYAPYVTQDVVSTFQKLKAAGFSRQEVPIVFQALGDVGALQGFDPQVLSDLSDAFATIKGFGHLDMRELRRVVLHGARSGLSMGAMMEEIGRELGKTPEEAAAMLHKGSIDANTAIQSVLTVIKEKVSHGELGSVMMKQGTETIMGLWSTLRSGFGDFLLTLDQDVNDMPGWKTIKGFILNLVSLFDTSTVAGKNFQKVVVDTFNTLVGRQLGDFTGEAGLKRMEGILKQVLNLFQKVYYYVGLAGDAATSFVKTILAAAGIDFDPLKEMSAADMASAKASAQDLGKAIAELVIGLGRLALVAGELTGLINPMERIGKAHGLAPGWEKEDVSFGQSLANMGKGAFSGARNPFKGDFSFFPKTGVNVQVNVTASPGANGIADAAAKGAEAGVHLAVATGAH